MRSSKTSSERPTLEVEAPRKRAATARDRTHESGVLLPPLLTGIGRPASRHIGLRHRRKSGLFMVEGR